MAEGDIREEKYAKEDRQNAHVRLARRTTKMEPNYMNRQWNKRKHTCTDTYTHTETHKHTRLKTVITSMNRAPFGSPDGGSRQKTTEYRDHGR